MVSGMADASAFWKRLGNDHLLELRSRCSLLNVSDDRRPVRWSSVNWEAFAISRPSSDLLIVVLKTRKIYGLLLHFPIAHQMAVR